MVHRKVRGGKFKIKHVEKQPPVAVGDELDVNIIEISPSGDGATKIQGFIINVPNAKPRERVAIRITEVGEKSAKGEIIK
jgi:predicted RNA-binding protein with TRAM domain